MSIKDDLLKHQIFILRYSGLLAKELKETLSQATALALKALKDNPEGLSKIELDKLHNKLLDFVAQTPQEQLNLLDKLMKYEAKFTKKVLQKNKIVKDVSLPNDESMQSALRTINMSVISDKQKKPIEVAYTQFVNEKITDIVRVIGDLSANKQIINRGS